ncbi:MAG: hypothetical protein EOP04_02835 [Proteobacteria bacterium]|nr:MAG: hypothetical protein EOP04_02835 [Pseudomonadota bacterium]
MNNLKLKPVLTVQALRIASENLIVEDFEFPSFDDRALVSIERPIICVRWLNIAQDVILQNLALPERGGWNKEFYKVLDSVDAWEGVEGTFASLTLEYLLETFDADRFYELRWLVQDLQKLYSTQSSDRKAFEAIETKIVKLSKMMERGRSVAFNSGDEDNIHEYRKFEAASKVALLLKNVDQLGDAVSFLIRNPPLEMKVISAANGRLVAQRLARMLLIALNPKV